MNRDIFYYINKKDPLYIKGSRAIEQQNKGLLEKVLADSSFDKESFEASGLLFLAAEKPYIEAFQMLGDAGVKMFQNLDNIKKLRCLRTHMHLEPIFLLKQETPLHVLIRKINAEALRSLDLEKHFKSDDIEATLNAYYIKRREIPPMNSNMLIQHIEGEGTPLQLAYESHLAANKFLKEHDCDITSEGFWDFYVCMKPFHPNVQAPLIVNDEMLFQKAIRLEDWNTLDVIASYTVDCLNALEYRYSKEEYDILRSFGLSERLKTGMLKGFHEETVEKKSTFRGWKKLAQIFNPQKIKH